MRIQELGGRKVALWGFGREGRATLRWLHKRLPELPLTVLNDNPLPANTETVENKNVRFLTGADAIKAIASYDIIIKSPGISSYRPEISDAQSQGVRFTSATQLWFDEHPQVKTVCVTGTKGKSTTSGLIAAMLRKSGVNAILGGNIGVPLLSLTDLPEPPEIMVIELSSYQTSDLHASPSVGLLLNLFPEHLDWHGNTANYFRDKIRLFNNMPDKSVIINHTDPHTQQFRHRWPDARCFNHPDGFHIAAPGRIVHICRGSQRLFDINHVRLPGRHNLSNICAALTVLEILGIDAAEAVETAAAFGGLPHRLQIIGEKNRVLYVDDSISTAPEATIAAVQSFQGRKITLLAGGFDRGLPLEQLAAFLVNQSGPGHNLWAVVTMPESGVRLADAIRKILACQPDNAFQLHEASDLEQAVSIAHEITPPQGVILLSPAAPSYGAFKNFEQRGKAFAAFVHQ
ncbi:UDP-N-acetylmuramoyl-L-alanine--D-glutamate ligase [Desulfococcaceae bacterium HSG9]|nr:UDP-N-acetylmuramoyl-L-alanine--D-glutamate ligase [Desulfococcaceae bacterium HSG9]